MGAEEVSAMRKESRPGITNEKHLSREYKVAKNMIRKGKPMRQ